MLIIFISSGNWQHRHSCSCLCRPGKTVKAGFWDPTSSCAFGKLNSLNFLALPRVSQVRYGITMYWHLQSLRKAPIFVSHTVKDLKLEHSCSLNFYQLAYHQTAKAKRTATVVWWSLYTRDFGLITSKSHTRLHFKYCPIIFTHMRKVDQMARKMCSGDSPGPSTLQGRMGADRSWTTKASPSKIKLCISLQCLL